MTVEFWGEKRLNGYLSNFYIKPIEIEGHIYPTVEHYFQSKKFEGTEWELYIYELETAKETAKQGKRRDLPLRSDWESVKEDIMYKGIKAKFIQHRELRKLLLQTGERDLVEVSPFDSYWGVGKHGTGKNRLGVLLMRLREELGE